jgi:hypothetical protein
MSHKPNPAILLDAGIRGADAYVPYALAQPDPLNIVGVTTPDTVRGQQPTLAMARDSLESQLVDFAAESRRSGTLIDMNRFRQNAKHFLHGLSS